VRAAAIGDVHANLPALEAVLADIQEQGAEVVWNTGDFVGHSPCPEETMQRLMDPDIVSVVGNYDLKVLKFPQKKEQWRESKRPHKFAAFRYGHDRLSEQSRRFLANLPRERRLMVEGWRVLLTHASPESLTEALKPDTPEERFRELAGMAEADVVVFGHSHYALARQVAGVWFVNTGTVGRPKGEDKRAVYALLDFEPGTLRVKHRRVAYEIPPGLAL
jgi:putative phosphoesterase